jgi:hypothetical protein
MTILINKTSGQGRVVGPAAPSRPTRPGEASLLHPRSLRQRPQAPGAGPAAHRRARRGGDTGAAQRLSITIMMPRRLSRGGPPAAAAAAGGGPAALF